METGKVYMQDFIDMTFYIGVEKRLKNGRMSGTLVEVPKFSRRKPSVRHRYSIGFPEQWRECTEVPDAVKEVL